MLYRLFTENKNHDIITKLANKYYEGYTLMQVSGYWQGKPEKSLLLEVVAKQSELEIDKFEHLAKQIKKENKQDAVLIETIPNSSKLI